MASRKQQKEEARARRVAEEQARAERERRLKRMQMLTGGALLVLVVAAVAIVIASSGGGSSGTGSPIKQANTAGVVLPAAKTTNLAVAVKAAGCTTIDTPDAIARSSQNRTHVDPGSKVTYATNPPSYGPHYPAPASDGEYKPSNTPATGFLVHALEHGRIEYQYNPTLPSADVKQLEALMEETDGQWGPGQLLLLFPNPTHMPYAVAATAWGHVLGCKTWSPRIFDALRAFRLKYTYQGPEFLGTGRE
jgi:Protein of unknown function (DUF3105)